MKRVIGEKSREAPSLKRRVWISSRYDILTITLYASRSNLDRPGQRDYSGAPNSLSDEQKTCSLHSEITREVLSVLVELTAVLACSNLHRKNPG